MLDCVVTLKRSWCMPFMQKTSRLLVLPFQGLTFMPWETLFLLCVGLLGRAVRVSECYM